MGEGETGQSSVWSRVESYTVPGYRLAGNSRRWYAQALADGLQRGGWQRLVAPKRKEQRSKFRLLSARPQVPALLECRARSLPKAFVPPAKVQLGWTGYQQAMAAMTKDELEAWWEWNVPRKDTMGRRIAPSAVFRSAGARVVAGDNATGTLQRAVLLLFDVSWVTWYLDDG